MGFGKWTCQEREATTRGHGIVLFQTINECWVFFSDFLCHWPTVLNLFDVSLGPWSIDDAENGTLCHSLPPELFCFLNFPCDVSSWCDVMWVPLRRGTLLTFSQTTNTQTCPLKMDVGLRWKKRSPPHINYSTTVLLQFVTRRWWE